MLPDMGGLCSIGLLPRTSNASTTFLPLLVLLLVVGVSPLPVPA